MKKIFLSLILVASVVASFAQSGSASYSGVFERVNDSTAYQTAAASKHAAGYSDTYWNNQATTPHYDIWNGSSYDHVFNFGSSGGGGSGTVNSGTAGQLAYYAGSGTTVSGATTGTGIVTALGVNVGSAGAPVINGGALGTPSSGTATNLTGTASGLTAGSVTTIPTLSGDVSNSGNAITVTKINGTSLAGLGTGILKNTTGTGVPSIATGADLPVMTSTVGGAVPTPPNNTTTFLRGDGTFASPSGSGDVVGPSSAIDNGIVTYDGTTGKLIKSLSARLLTNGTNGAKGHYFGYSAGNSNTLTVSDGFNTGLGYEALLSVTDGASNFNSSYLTALGYKAGRAITTGRYITAVGFQAGMSATTAVNSIFVGSRSGSYLTNQTDNTFVGDNTGSSASNTGISNTFIGSTAGSANTTGDNGTFVGLYAGFTNTTGDFNTFVGSESGETNTTGAYNAYFGHWTGLYVRGSGNTFIGGDSWGQTITNPSSGDYNVGVGYRTGLTETSANHSKSGSYNTFIGTESGLGSTTQVWGSTALGRRARVYSKNSMVFGSDTDSLRVNYGFGGESYGGGKGIAYIKNYVTAPTGNPSNGFWLYSNSGVATVVNSTGSAFAILANPMTTAGDLILGGASGVAGRLAIGSNGYVLTSNGTTASWQAASAGFADPMTTRGDIIVRNSSNNTARLGIGSANQVLISDGTDISWGSVPGAYLLASGGARTASNTLSGNFPVAYTGTYTGASDATPIHAYNINMSVTHTGSATNKVASILNVEGTVTGSGGGGTQELAGIRIAPTFNTSAGSRNFYIEAISSTGGHAFEVREETEDSRNTIMKVLGGTSSATEASMQIQTNTTYWTSTGPSNYFTNSSSSTAAFTAFTINSTQIGIFSNASTNFAGRGFQVSKAGASAAATASQVGSVGINWWGSFWTGAASLDAGFYAATVASTATNRLGWWRLRENISASDPGDILSVEGGSTYGLGIGTSDPSARLHIVAGTATAGTAPIKLESGTNLTTAETGAIEYNGTNLFFTRTGTTRESIITANSVNSVSPTSPNRTITVVIDGVTLYISAKTTND